MYGSHVDMEIDRKSHKGMARQSEIRTSRRGCVVKRVALIGAWAIAVLILVWVACEATSIEVGTGPLVVFFIVVFATCFAMDFLGRRIADARMASGVAAGAAIIIVWAGVEMADLEIENGVYIVLFAATFTAHFLGLRRRGSRARRTSASPHR